MKEDLAKAARVISEGGIILYPTDTIWGIGCDATNKEAVKRIYDIKQREDTKSMLVLMYPDVMLQTYLKLVPEIAWDLLDVATNPLTIIYPGARNLADNLLAPDRSIGIRIPDEPFCTNLIGALRKPIVSTSANISGHPPPANFGEIDPILFEKVDYVVQWRQEDLSKSKPSSILKVGTEGQIEIIRE